MSRDPQGVKNLEHALTDLCTDPDCEIHNPEVGIREGTVTLTDLAFFVAGASQMRDLLLNDFENSCEENFKENFRDRHQEAINIAEGRYDV